MRRLGLKAADGAQAKAVVGEDVEEAGVGNTKEGEEEKGGKRRLGGG